MSHSHAKILLHLVFGTWDRKPLITRDFENDLHAYIGGVVKGLDSVPVAIGGVEDHVHALVQLHPSIAPAEMVRTIKSNSSRWINQNEITSRRFRWQGGYGCYSVSMDRTDTVARYVRNQREHHRKTSFEEELRKICEEAGVDFDGLPGST